MKLDAPISEKRLRKWAEAEAAARAGWGSDMSVAMHNGKRLLWFFGGEIYVDGYVFAECYNMPASATQEQISERIVKLLGKVRVTFDDELPVQHTGDGRPAR